MVFIVGRGGVGGCGDVLLLRVMLEWESGVAAPDKGDPAR